MARTIGPRVRSRFTMKTKLVAIASLVLGLAALGAVFNSASATQPTVNGVIECPDGGGVNIVWTVGGDTNYPGETATITSQSIPTNPTLVGKTVQNTGTVSGVQSGATPGNHTMMVEVDWTNGHHASSQATVTVSNDDCAETQEEPVSLCHATGSESNPFVLITISPEGAYNGHLGSGHQNGEDIIPPFEYQGQTYSQNWDAVGQELFNNGCVVEAPEVIQIPAQPALEDPCGPNNAEWIKPEDTDVLHWAINDAGHLIVSIVSGDATFPDGSLMHDYGVAVDSGEECPNPPEEAVGTAHATAGGCIRPNQERGVVVITVFNTADETGERVAYQVNFGGAAQAFYVADGGHKSLRFRQLPAGDYPWKVIGGDGTKEGGVVTVETCKIGQPPTNPPTTPPVNPPTNPPASPPTFETGLGGNMGDSDGQSLVLVLLLMGLVTGGLLSAWSRSSGTTTLS